MAQYTHDVRSDDDGDSVDSHYSDSDHGHSDYEENAHACHDESDDDKANESIVKYTCNPSTSKHNYPVFSGNPTIWHKIWQED